jgi:hypothetical protein
MSSRGRVRLCRSLILGLTIAYSFSGAAFAQDPDESLRLYAVHINRTPQQAWTGYGIYLGRGLVITAAHVIGWAFWNKPRVEIAGKNLATKVVKEGSLNSVDVSLVSVDEEELPVSLRLRRMTVCPFSPFAEEQVVVVTPEGIARSRVMSPYSLPPNLSSRFGTVIRDVATTGNSGSGVFDENGKCLLGIISRKIFGTRMKEEDGKPVSENYDIAKYFVPSPAIIGFMPAGLHF